MFRRVGVLGFWWFSVCSWCLGLYRIEPHDPNPNPANLCASYNPQPQTNPKPNSYKEPIAPWDV